MTFMARSPQTLHPLMKVLLALCLWFMIVPAMAAEPRTRIAQAEIGEAEIWERAKGGSDRALLEMYLRVFPAGAHAEQARALLQSLPAGGIRQPRTFLPGEKGWVGVEIRAVELTPEQRQQSGHIRGLRVISLVSYGPGKTAGILVDDIIVAVNGTEVEQVSPFVARVSDMGAGAEIRLSVLRGGNKIELPVTLGGRFTDSLDAAKAGDPEAQLQVGYAYANGIGVEKDPIKGFEWYMKAANQGNVHALHNVGNAYFYGRGVPKDQAAAIPWYYTAATKGHANAQTHTGYAYANGIGVPRSDELAAEWYKKAVEQNEPFAMNNLALLYDEGRGGLPKSRATAVELLRRAALLGNELAMNNLKGWGVPPYDPAALQRALADLGFDPGPVDGKIGRKTRDAIRAVQKELGLKEDGKASIELLKSLQDAVARGGLKTNAN